MRLDCGRCVVRDWQSSDKASLLAVANNRNVWRNLSHRFPHPYTDADAEVWFARLAHEPKPTNWAVDVDGCAVGGIGVHRGEGVFSMTGTFGYWLGEPFWGRGIMSAAVRSTSDHILANLDYARLESPVFAWNPASMRVLEKSGFTRESVQRKSIFKDGELIDASLYVRFKG